jgi:hypothetical protein
VSDTAYLLGTALIAAPGLVAAYYGVKNHGLINSLNALNSDKREALGHAEGLLKGAEDERKRRHDE